MNEIVFCKNCEKRYTQNCGLYHGTINGKEYYVENGDNFGCIYGKEKNDIIITNYDRIKSMSVEEMAVFIRKIQDETIESFANFIMPPYTYETEKWLLQEVSDDDR